MEYVICTPKKGAIVTDPIRGVGSMVFMTDVTEL